MKNVTFLRRRSVFTLALASIALLAVALLVAPRLPSISRQRAIEIATQACRVPHLVLVGEPRSVRARLVTFRGILAWDVELDGPLQIVGGPATASVPVSQPVTPTPPQPFDGTCTAIVNAKTGEWLETTGRSVATPS